MKNFKDAVKEILTMFEREEFTEQLAISIIRRRSDEDVIPSDNWSILNRLIMLMIGRTEDARTYLQWQSIGRQVKKGAKAFQIIAPMTKKIIDEETGEEEIKLIGFKGLPVFAIECTDGEPIKRADYKPERLTLNMERLIEAVEAMGATVDWSAMRGTALGSYRPADNTIKLHSESYVVLAHEAVHFAHNTFEDVLSIDSAKAEIVAELGAAVLCVLADEKGYEKQSYEYIRTYAKTDDPKVVIKAVNSVLTTVEKAVGIIIDNMVPPALKEPPAL